MSLNISNKLLRVATDVTVTVDTTKLGPRQQTALKRMVKTGIIKGNSVVAGIAIGVRHAEGLGYVYLRDYGAVVWRCVAEDNDTFFDQVAAVGMAMRLVQQDRWDEQRATAALDAAQLRPSTGYIYVPLDLKGMFKDVVLPKRNAPVTDLMTISIAYSV